MKIDIRKVLSDKLYCESAFRHYVKIGVLRKTGNFLFEKHMNKAVSNLDFANFLMEEHKFSIKDKLPGRAFYDWCITIYYYSIYHTALALTAKIGFESKSHLATIIAITLFYYHRDNLLKKEDVEFIISNVHLGRNDIDLVIDAKEIRERASYNVDSSFELGQARMAQMQAADFVSRIRALLEDIT
ncbi:MAG: hypothetical protein PHO02_07260 [Candidatus Nanoarchaeia archaeon]|nr:hypothetical protein [Candidatus Nanoarchaeia archaeon]